MQDLNSPAFFAGLQQCVKIAKIEPAALGLELTERCTADRDAATQAIAGLKSTGHAVFIDDFGTGYSSLAYLHELAVDGIKIDRAFTATVGTDALIASVVPQILDMASQLGLLVVVEGIESSSRPSISPGPAGALWGRDGSSAGRVCRAVQSQFGATITEAVSPTYAASQPS